MNKKLIIFLMLIGFGNILSAKTCNDLWLERNLIFAKKGYCFKSKEGKSVFGNEKCKTNNPKLTKAKKSRVNKLYQQEKKLHCTGFKETPLKNQYYQISPNTKGIIIEFGGLLGLYPKIQKKHKSLLSKNRYLISRWLPSYASERYFYIPLNAKNIKALAIDDSGKWIKVSYDPGIGKSMEGWIEKKYLKKQDRIDKKFEELRKTKEKALNELFSFSTPTYENKEALKMIDRCIANIFDNNRFEYCRIVYKCEKEKRGTYKCMVDEAESTIGIYDPETNDFEGGESGAIILFRFEKKNNKVKIKEIVGSNIAG